MSPYTKKKRKVLHKYCTIFHNGKCSKSHLASWQWQVCSNFKGIAKMGMRLFPLAKLSGWRSFIWLCIFVFFSIQLKHKFTSKFLAVSVTATSTLEPANLQVCKVGWFVSNVCEVVLEKDAKRLNVSVLSWYGRRKRLQNISELTITIVAQVQGANIAQQV